MGLAVSRGLAQAMGGSLTAVAELDAGATFLVSLPEVAAPSGQPSPQAGPATGQARPVPEISAGSARVLYVEDNPSNRRLVERIVERRPAWSQTHAPGGVMGLELARATRFDLILLDRHLPDLEGLAVLRALRELQHGLAGRGRRTSATNGGGSSRARGW